MATKLPKSPPVKIFQVRWPGEGVVRGLSYEREYAAANYPTPWSINVRSQESIASRLRGGSWTPIAAGARPSETIYRDRKLTYSANIISASRMSSHADYTYSADVSDTIRATQFQLSETDETGGTVVALVPHKDMVLLAATTGELWCLHGDPTTGQLRNVSREVGMINANAWCKADDIVYFLSSSGLYSVGADGSGLKPLSEDTIPVELTSVTDAGCTLTYHHADRGVYIHLPNTAQSWFYDIERNAFWPFVSSEADSHVLFGPLRIGGPVEFGMVRTIHGILGAGSADVMWRIIVGDTTHVVPADYIDAVKTVDVTATITAIEATVDPDGWFASDSGTHFKVTTSAPHGMHDGQTITFSGSTATFTLSGVTVSLNTKTARIRVGVSGYTSSQFEMRISGTGATISGADGTVHCSIQYMPAPTLIAAAQNELYAAYSQCTTCWINIPPAFTDEAFTAYVQALDAALTVGIKIRVEWANETYNTASEGINRYARGMGVLEGQSQTTAVDWYTAHRTYELWKLLKAACPTRDVAMVLAGQALSPSVLKTRMAYYFAEWKADTDPDKGTWEALPLWMSVSNYQDPIDVSSGAEGLVNREGLPQMGPLGIAETWDWGLRPYSSYTVLTTGPVYDGDGDIVGDQYGKTDLVGYEGGAYSEGVIGTPAIIRGMFAGQWSPEYTAQCYQNWTAAQDAGFTGVCPLPLQGKAYEDTAKCWSCTGFSGQVAGVGDGSDGLADNLDLLPAYRADGTTNWLSLVSPALYAVQQWAGLDAPDPPLPTPTGLTATHVSDTRIDLAWTDVAGESGYLIYRSQDNVTYTPIGATGAGEVAYSATGLDGDTLYYFRVQATDGVPSALSDEAHDTTDPTTPPITTVMGFRSPFPFILGLMGGTTYVPQALTVSSVHDYINDLHGRVDVLGMSVSGTGSGTRTTVREHQTANRTDILELEVVE